MRYIFGKYINDVNENVRELNYCQSNACEADKGCATNIVLSFSPATKVRSTVKYKTLALPWTQQGQTGERCRWSEEHTGLWSAGGRHVTTATLSLQTLAAVEQKLPHTV